MKGHQLRPNLLLQYVNNGPWYQFPNEGDRTLDIADPKNPGILPAPIEILSASKAETLCEFFTILMEWSDIHNLTLVRISLAF